MSRCKCSGEKVASQDLCHCQASRLFLDELPVSIDVRLEMKFLGGTL